MSHLRHFGKDFLKHNPCVSLVMEYANSGDLQQRIKAMREKNQMFTEDVICKILVQMVLGINALHSLRIMHRDLKVSFK